MKTSADAFATQAAFGLPQTGVFDEKTFAKWKDVVDTGARLTAAGRKMNLMEIVVKTAKSRGSGGSGGSSGGGAGYSASEVKAFFNSVAEDELGREATAEEHKAFFAALRGAGDVDPQQFAIDWIRGRAGGEAGAYSAVNYYEAMMQILGSNSSAVGA